jgi:copper transporter 1
MLQFGLAYLIMLFAMYYNGFVIINIVVRAWLGAFVFGWESIDVRYVCFLV